MLGLLPVHRAHVFAAITGLSKTFDLYLGLSPTGVESKCNLLKNGLATSHPPVSKPVALVVKDLID